MIPLRDDNPTSRRPVVTLALVAVCTAVFLLQGAGSQALDPVTARFSMVPARVMGDADLVLRIPSALGQSRITLPEAAVPEWLTLLSCIFLHGSWLHLIGNMWFLWIFGDNVEERFGRLKFLLFYLGAGALASLSHLLSEPHSKVPTVGASGAIAGVMGAYLWLYPHARVLTLVPLGFFLHLAVLPAYVFLLLWFALQTVSGLVSLGSSATGGVAWWAHIGGFVAGLLFALALGKSNKLKPAPRTIALSGRRVGPPARRRSPFG